MDVQNEETWKMGQWIPHFKIIVYKLLHCGTIQPCQDLNVEQEDASSQFSPTSFGTIKIISRTTLLS